MSKLSPKTASSTAKINPVMNREFCIRAAEPPRLSPVRQAVSRYASLSAILPLLSERVCVCLSAGIIIYRVNRSAKTLRVYILSLGCFYRYANFIHYV